MSCELEQRKMDARMALRMMIDEFATMDGVLAPRGISSEAFGKIGERRQIA